MKLIVGLGNPGKKYQKTRHNVGFRAVDLLADHISWKESKKFHAQLFETTIAGKKFLLAKPQTYMNESGKAVTAIIRFYKLNLNDILVIHDDIDLLLGQIRLRSKGSAGGHNGMASVINSLGSENVSRLKIGIAETKGGKQSIPSEDYVLRPFTSVGEKILQKTLKEIPKIVAQWIQRV